MTNPTVFPLSRSHAWYPCIQVTISFSLPLAQRCSACLLLIPCLFHPYKITFLHFSRRTKDFRKQGFYSGESLFSLLSLLSPPTAPSYLCSSGGGKKKRKRAACARKILENNNAIFHPHAHTMDTQTCPLSKVVPIFISHLERCVQMNQGKLLTRNVVIRKVKYTRFLITADVKPN